VKTDRDDPSCLKSRIEVRYPPEDFLRTFWNNSIDFLAKVTSYASRWRPEIGQTGSVTSSPEKLKAQKSHSVWANYTYIAHAGTQAALDFYHVPPPGIARYAANQGTAGLELIPVVRVVISVFDLVDLFVKAKSVVEEIQSQLPAAEREKMDEPSRRAEEA
jgi:hypothetical protein